MPAVTPVESSPYPALHSNSPLTVSAPSPLEPIIEPSPTPNIPTLVPLTDPGCCVGAFWSPDGSEVRFIDRPDATGQTGIYGVDLVSGELRLVSQRVGILSPDGRYLAYLNRDYLTVVVDIGEDRSWIIPNGGREVFFSPSSRWLAWSEVARTGVYGNERTTIYISGIDGRDARELVELNEGRIMGWLDDDRLLLLGREPGAPMYSGLFSLSVVDGSRVDLVQKQRLSAVRIAPGGEWVSYVAMFSPLGPQEDGLWIVKTNDGAIRHHLPVVGSARWRDVSHLLIIPIEPSAPAHRLIQFDISTGMVDSLTDPSTFPFRVSAGEWSVSPTGDYVVFLSAEDQALWLFDLPPVEP